MRAISDELNQRIRYTSSGIVQDGNGNRYDSLTSALAFSLNRAFTLFESTAENLSLSNCSITSTNESAIMGSLAIGANVTLRGLRLYYDGWVSRESTETGSEPSDIPDVNVSVTGANSAIINCYIHDYKGFLVSSSALNFSMRGTVFGRMGWTAPDRGHGHGIYIQPVNGNMEISNCVGIENYGYGLNIYKQSEALSGILIEDCPVFGSGLHGVFYSDILYGGYFVNGASSFLRNACLGGGTSLEFWKDDSTLAAVDVTITDNILPNGIGGIYEAASETGNSETLGNGACIIPNEDDDSLFTLIIRNAALANSVQVDVSEYLEPLQSATLINTQDYLVDRQALIVDSNGMITVDMQAANHTISSAIAGASPESCFPAFGVFILKAG